MKLKINKNVTFWHICDKSFSKQIFDKDIEITAKVDKCLFLNLPLWANFYNHTDLSHSTSTTLDQPTLLDDLNLTSTLNQASPAAQVEEG